MQVISGRRYYSKEEFEKEILLRFLSKGEEIGINNNVGQKVSSIPPVDITGTPMGVRMYAIDDIPIFNTYVNENGFYFMKPVKL